MPRQLHKNKKIKCRLKPRNNLQQPDFLGKIKTVSCLFSQEPFDTPNRVALNLLINRRIPLDTIGNRPFACQGIAYIIADNQIQFAQDQV